MRGPDTCHSMASFDSLTKFSTAPPVHCSLFSNDRHVCGRSTNRPVDIVLHRKAPEKNLCKFIRLSLIHIEIIMDFLTLKSNKIVTSHFLKL